MKNSLINEWAGKPKPRPGDYYESEVEKTANNSRYEKLYLRDLAKWKSANEDSSSKDMEDKSIEQVVIEILSTILHSVHPSNEDSIQMKMAIRYLAKRLHTLEQIIHQNSPLKD